MEEHGSPSTIQPTPLPSDDYEELALLMYELFIGERADDE